MTEEKIMQEEQTPPAQEPPKKKPQVGEIGENGYVVRKKRWGDRNDGRRLRTIPAMTKFMPYIMRDRCDALNTFADSFDLTRTDPFCRRKVKEGKSNFTLLHVILAAYVRAISQKPGINRFVAGQRIYARNEISVNMTIKKSMKIDSPDTCIKVVFAPDDTAEEIYEKFNAVVQQNQESEDGKSGFDKIMDFFTKFPRPILRGVVSLVKWFDYHSICLLPDLPFYGSMIITSMGSLGIPAIYHHIYDFGNLPVFLSFGKKYFKLEAQPDGTVTKRKNIDLKVVTDERICDGFYYAAAFKYINKIIEHPEMLDERPETVVEDID